MPHGITGLERVKRSVMRLDRSVLVFKNGMGDVYLYGELVIPAVTKFCIFTKP
jgi:hypothetical protein